MPTVENAASTDQGLAAELRVAVMRLRRRLAVERHPDNELSLATMAVLGALHRSGELSIGELAAHERVRPPSMTRTVKCLEEAGYVSRRAHETDGRQVLVTVTDAGRATLLADRERRDVWLSDRLADLTPHERQVLHEAAPILDRLSQED
ncbi:MarR family winged helix-turn-helix transcriptional regulator [Nocardioides sp.]|uniref:MarR family winged helix-turn-helix transcriptional regulator n=1 Tax=Nocardioides sp. TaxID=35761 RepID=UPI003564F968